MKIHEFQAIEIFKKAGILACEGGVATSFSEAERIADHLEYPVVLKSQVLAGGRGKAGGVKLVKRKEDLKSTFEKIQGLTIQGFRVERILIVRALEIKQEYYAAITVDHTRNDVVLIASSEGGVDIEQTAKKAPQKIHKFYLQGKKEIDQERLSPFIKVVFKDVSSQEQGTQIFQALLKVFYQFDCSLTEINPLVRDTSGRLIAADAKINFDDNALFRHTEIALLSDLKFEDPDELEAKEKGLSFVKMDGNVGCIVNGAGLAMATMDVIKLLGGEPANFLDVGGSSNPEKVLNAMKIILRNPKVKSILINIFGGITRCDDIANGIITAKKELNLRVPIVVRLTGTNEEEAKEILAKENMQIFSTMREAVRKAVELAK